MTSDDHAALASLGGKMAALNGYTPMQSSSLYITDGDEIDWAYGHEHIFMYTFEMYPSKRLVTSTARFYPPDEVITPQTERNKGAILRLMDAAGCPYSVIGKAVQNCGPLYDDFETAGGWVTNPNGTDTATSGLWQRGDPQATSRQAGHRSLGLSGAGHREARRREREFLRRRWHHDHPIAGDRPSGDGRLADVPLLLRPQRELVVVGLLPGLRRECRRRSDAGEVRIRLR